MGFLDALKSLFTSEARDADGYWVYVRCRRCGETIKTRIDLRNSLSARDEGGYVVNKTLMGSGKNNCFQRIEVSLVFDNNRKLTDRAINFGEFITAEAYAADQSIERGN